MDGNPYESSGVVTTAKPSLWRLVWPAFAVVFCLLWGRAEYLLFTLHQGNEVKDKAVAEWSNRDPEFRAFLSDRLNHVSSIPHAE
jgi:hypothetical protein